MDLVSRINEQNHQPQLT